MAHLPLNAGIPLNKEGEDLPVPLPQEWNLQKLKALPIIYYGAKVSPPCCKIRFLLKFYGVSFEEKNGPKPGSEYKKIPVLDVGDRQINDSYIIVKSLSPILAGRPLTKEEIDFDHLITFGVMLALEKHTASSVRNLCRCAGLIGGGMGCGLALFSPFVACCVAPSIGRDKNIKTLPEYGQEVLKFLGSKDFFGGQAPSINDVALFGMLVPFVAATDTADALLGEIGSPLRAWHDRMDGRCHGINIL